MPAQTPHKKGPMLYAELRPREVLDDPHKMLAPYKGFLMSEKFDGWRGLWDGKAMRTKTRKRTFQLPAGWRRILPPGVHLDGEIFIQGEPASRVATLLNNPDHLLWKKATYRVFDIPSQGQQPFQQREKSYTSEVKKACRHAAAPCPVRAVPQTKAGSPQAILKRYKSVLARKGEGLVLTNPESKYVHGKVNKYSRVKLKGRNDKEGKVVGWKKQAGLLSSLTVEIRPGLRFQLGIGFSKRDRTQFRTLFPKGTVVKYSYEKEHKSGLPRHARFVGVRHASE
jgi:DNA ligase 1